jgi:hypothetical protein
MDPEEREKLERIEHLSEENHEILEKLHRIEKRRLFFRILYWTAIIGLSLGAYWLIQPYLDALRGATDGAIDFERFIPGGREG